jgi:hypothetical protein
MMTVVDEEENNEGSVNWRMRNVCYEDTKIQTYDLR